ncbi:MAG TPA: Wzz/FepE/Etk N-terminal domain-containing protein [Gammaproteobacteria bacterium]|nr:Wzz/FepE/Etk N-terminal domain-containing protein [Gammaproteobacteria bacterium]
MSHGSAAAVRSVRRSLQAAADLWSILFAGKWLLLGCAFTCALVAVAIAYALPVKYRAETLLKPARTDNNMLGQLGAVGGLASLAGLALPTDDRSAEARALLESKEFSMEFVRNENLLPVLFEKDWDAEAGRWRTNDPKRIPTELDAYRLLRDKVRTVSQDPQSRMVLLAIEWKDPELAASWANKMVALLNDKMRADALARSRRNLDFLRDEYEKTTVAPLREAISSVMENELQTSMLSSVERDYAFRVIDPAIVPNRRSSPNRVLIAVSGLAIGLALGTLAAVARFEPR